MTGPQVLGAQSLPGQGEVQKAGILVLTAFLLLEINGHRHRDTFRAPSYKQA